MSMTNYLEKKLLDHVFANVPYTRPATLYLGAFTVAPADDGTGGTELTVGANGYARVAINSWNPAVLGNPTLADNAALVQFPVCTGSPWGTIVALGIFDASTGGNLLDFGAINKSIAVDDVLEVPAGAYDITLD